jgi:hypothetical protein
MEGGKLHASKNGILRGVKPADNVPNSWSLPERSTTPAIEAAERNLCLKRRENSEAKVAETRASKRTGRWASSPLPRGEGLSQVALSSE